MSLKKNIHLDNEAVDFSGNIPKSAIELYTVLSEHLATQNRILTSFIVDDTEQITPENTDLPQNYQSVIALSSTFEAILAATIENTLQQTQLLPQELKSFAHSLLSTPWSETLNELDAFSAKLQPLNAQLEQLNQYQRETVVPWKDRKAECIQDLESHLTSFIQAAQSNDVAQVSEIINHTITPWVQQTQDWLDSSVKSELQHFNA